MYNCCHANFASN